MMYEKTNERTGTLYIQQTSCPNLANSYIALLRTCSLDTTISFCFAGLRPDRKAMKIPSG